MQWHTKLISPAGPLREITPCSRGVGKGRRARLGRYSRGVNSGGRVRDRAARVTHGHILLVWLCCGILGPTRADAAPTNSTNGTTAPTTATPNYTDSAYNRNFFFLLFLCLVPLTAFMVGNLIKIAFPVDQDPDKAWYRCLRRRSPVAPATDAGELAEDDAAKKAQAAKKEREERQLRGAVFLLFSVDKPAKEEEMEMEKEWKTIQRELKRMRERRLRLTVRRNSRAAIVPPDERTLEEWRQKMNSEGNDNNRAETIVEASEASSIKGEHEFADAEEKANNCTEEKPDSTSEDLNDDKSISSTQALLQNPDRTEKKVDEEVLVRDKKDKEPSADVPSVKTAADDVPVKSNDDAHKDRERARAKTEALNSAGSSAGESHTASSAPSKRRRRRGATSKNRRSNSVEDHKQEIMTSPENGQRPEGAPAAPARPVDLKEDSGDASTAETSLNVDQSLGSISSDAKSRQPTGKSATSTVSSCLDSRQPNSVVSLKKTDSAVVQAANDVNKDIV